MNSDRAIGGWFKAEKAAVLTACGETMAVVRKKALLRILARRDADRENIRITDIDIQVTSEWFRREFGLVQDEDLSRWMTDQGLTEAAFATAMRDFTVVRLLEEAYAREIDELATDQIAISTARFLQV